MPNFTIIAYRPESYSTCRGCVMDNSSSDMDIKTGLSFDDALAFWASKLFEDQFRSAEYAQWELTLLIDGLPSDDWIGSLDDENHETLHNSGAADLAWSDMNNLAQSKLNTLIEEKKQADRIKVQAEEASIRATAALKKREADDRDKLEFARLSKKFNKS